MFLSSIDPVSQKCFFFLFCCASISEPDKTYKNVRSLLDFKFTHPHTSLTHSWIEVTPVLAQYDRCTPQSTGLSPLWNQLKLLVVSRPQYIIQMIHNRRRQTKKKTETAHVLRSLCWIQNNVSLIRISSICDDIQQYLLNKGWNEGKTIMHRWALIEPIKVE